MREPSWAVVVTEVGLAWWTRAHWGDIQIDCGRELYIPSQIECGKLLYRDLWYQYGPLEPYFAALLVLFFGQHLNVFYIYGLAMAIGSALLFFEIGRTVEQRAVGRREPARRETGDFRNYLGTLRDKAG